MLKPLNKISGWLVAALVISIQSARAAESLDSLLKQSSKDGKYVQVAPDELVQAETLFRRTLNNPEDKTLHKDWQAIGFELLPINEPEATYFVLRELTTRREGRGFYAIRAGKSDKSLLQAPHSFKDEHTREIVLHMMHQSQFAAAAWNTVPRSYIDKEKNQMVDADMAHLEQTFFVAFGRAFGSVYKNSNIIQMHGFSKEKRKSGAGEQADMVLSSGTAYATPAVQKMSGCMKRQLTPNAKLYPDEVRELGGTTNSTGDALRQIGHNGFIHIEMSAQIRLQALKDTAFTTHLLGCLPK